MVYGAEFWNDRDMFYIQTNNPTEALLSKVMGKLQLETCGPTACVNCVASLGSNVEVSCPGEYKPQPEEVVEDFLNDPRNFAEFERIRTGVSGIPGNRIPQYYPYAAKMVFGVDAEFMWISGMKTVIEGLKNGRPSQVCFIEPGHFVAIVAWDEEINNFIYNDGWPERTRTDGFNLKIPFESAERLFQKYAIMY